MSEIIVPGRRQVPDTLYVVDRHGHEVEIPTEEIWQYLPDASGETYTIEDLGKLPYSQWEKGEQDD